MAPHGNQEKLWWLYMATVCSLASITLMQSLVTLSGLLWLVCLLGPRRYQGLPDLGLTTILVALLGWSLVSAAASPEPGRSLEASGVSLMWVVAPLGTVLLDRSRSRTLQALLLLQAGLMGCWAVAEYFLWWDGNPLSRVRAPYSSHMTLAGVLLVCTVQGLARPSLAPLLGDGRRALWLGRAALAAGLIGLGATHTRSAVLAAVCGGAVVLITAPQLRWSAALKVSLAAATVILVTTALTVPWLVELQRSESQLSAGAASFQDRLVLWEAGLKMVEDRPLVGIGANRVRREAVQVMDPEHRRPGPPSHLHSAPLTLAAERGLPALALFVVLYAATFWRWLRLAPAERREAVRRGGMAAVVSFLVMGLFEDNFDDVEVLFVHLVTLAMLWAPSPDAVAEIDRDNP